LLHVKRPFANCADETIARLFPMKDLAAIKCFCQIEIRRNDLGHVHRQGTYHRGMTKHE